MLKKTIIYTGGFELPDKNAAAQRVLSNAKIFRDLGFNVVLVGIDKSLPSHTHIKETRSLVQGFETWAVPYPSGKKSWFKYITTSKPLEYIVAKFYNNDLYGVICYNYPAIAQLRIRSFCQQKDALFIPDATEWYESSGGGVIFNIIKWLDTSLRMRYVHPKADGIITTSQYLTDFYRKRKCITVELPTLYDVSNLTYTAMENDRTDTIKLMYAGSAFNLDRIDKNRSNIKDRLDKIILMLHKVHQKRSNFVLDIFGLTRENYLSVFPEHTDILDELSNVITFHGRQPHTEIIKQIQKSDFTIFLRNIERVIEAGFPSKFSESISYGTPVICNMISNIQPYVKEGENCFILELDDLQAQVEKLLQILTLTADERKQLKSYCANHHVFDYKKYTDSVKQFLQKIGTQNEDK